MRVKQVHDFLAQLMNHEPRLHQAKPHDFKLDRMRALVKALAIDKCRFPLSFHVAGSKGKGSTAVMIATLLARVGFKVGLYTSPHMVSYHERIRILTNDKKASQLNRLFDDAISDDDLTEQVQAVGEIIQKINMHSDSPITFYECFTAMAYRYFFAKQVDIVVIETGLGGRLDATNVFDHDIAVITPISLEHVDLLGSTTPLIAKEKAGIIKNTTRSVVVAPQDDDVTAIFTQQAKNCGSSIDFISQEWQYRYLCPKGQYDRWELKLPGLVEESFHADMALMGEHQVRNFFLALKALMVAKYDDHYHSSENLKSVMKNVVWPCRCEWISNQPKVLIDGAHNGASIQVLVETLMKRWPNYEWIVVLGIGQDKDLASVTQSFRDLNIVEWICTSFDHPRSWDRPNHKNVEKYISREVLSFANTSDALWAASRNASASRAILVTGSLFLASEVRCQILDC